LFLLACTLVFIAVSGLDARAAERRIILFEDADYFGFDYETLRGRSLDQCQEACLGDANCRAFTYNAEARWCFLKSDLAELRSVPGAIAGQVAEYEISAEERPQRPDFLPHEIEREAQELTRELVQVQIDPAKGIHGLLAAADEALGNDDPRAAAELYQQALTVNEEDFKAWSGFALAVLSMRSDDYSERNELIRDGTAAAYSAYVNAPDMRERAQALALMARALERRQMYRPALESYKASLLLADSAQVRAAFDELYAQYGFRILDHTVDSESASPRVCIQFSEELQAGRTDYSNFVTVDQSSPASVSVDGYQICVDGLKHGERYQIGLRAGIPAEVGETLQRPVALTVYVPDRQPSVRFTGRNFVLPRVGSHGIPLVSVNTDAVEVALYLIGERALSGTVTQEQLFSQLTQWSAQDIASNSGSLVWEGVLEVEQSLNREVTTSFPIDAVLPERLPGVYVMVAKPVEGREDYWNARATQWFVVSDIGLSSLMGSDGLHVFARSLSEATALPAVEMTLLARNNSVLGTTTTDDQGHAQFAAGLTRGTGGTEAALLTASVGGLDFAFLDLTRPGFDLTDRGVEGRASPGPLDVFVYAERGVYRPGETVHIAGLVRDADARAVSGTPLTFVFSRPDGVEFRREVVRDGGLGGYQVDFDLQESAMRGTWRAQVFVDPKDAGLAELQFLVEDFVPDRIEFDLETQAPAMSRDDVTGFDVEGRFLYGAPASALRLEGEVAVRPVDTIAGFTGFRFGLGDEEVLPVRVPLEGLPATDTAGRAHVDVALEALPASTRPLEAEVIVRMREAGGRAVQRTLVLPVAADGPQIGIRPQFNDMRVREGETAQFDVIGVSADRARTDLGAATWELFRLERDFQWYEMGGTWTYETVTYSTRVADGSMELDADAPARISAQVGWGRYRLEVTSTAPGGPASSVEFYAGWYVDLAAADTPDILEIALDKASYSPGETATVNIAPRFSGEALVMVMNERLIATYPVSVGVDGASIEIPVGDDWGAGAYVTAVQFRATSVAQSRMPGRAIGLQWLAVDTHTRTLGVSLDTPELVRPHDLLDVPVTLAGLSAGEEAYVTVAAVDVGILNLTNYQPPAPEDWYFGQRRLGLDIRDLYGLLIDGMAGVQGRIRSGGGEAAQGLTGTPPTQELVALFSGIVKVDDEGRASIQFDVPEFTGTLRVMAAAWSKAGVGHGTSDVVVRDPVVLTLSGPRFLAPGDISHLRLEVDNLEGPDGDYAVSVSFTDEIDVAQPGLDMNIAGGERQAAIFDLAALAPGVASLSVRLRHADGIDISRSYTLGIRPAQPYVSEREVVELAPGASLALDADRLAGYVDGTAGLTVSVSRAGSIDVPSLLHALDRYPYGCSEQITSRALPLLYLAQVAEQSGLGREQDLRIRVQEAIVDVLAHQSSSGSFGLWGPGAGDLWLDAYVSDFLTRAREHGYQVPELALMQALDSLQNQLGYAPEVSGAGQDVAYALYVLARNRRASLGDLRYYVDTKLTAFGSAMAKAHLGAALALYGERARSMSAFDAALSDLASGQEGQAQDGYATPLRDGAATLALAAETSPAPASLADMTRLVAQLQSLRSTTSTQENAWLLLAARGLLADTRDLKLEVNGEAHEGNLMRRFDAEYLGDEPLSLANRGTGPVDVVLTATGSPATARPAGGNGFTIERKYYSLAGEPVGIEQVGQNERFVVVLTVTEATAWRSRLLVADLLPAGFEIDNPNLVQGVDTDAFAWLPYTPSTANLEFRDDRFVAALDRSSYDDRSFTLAYVVRAVTPGRYVAPPALVEDMYRPHLNGWSETGRVEVIGPRP
jgi:hypothetical protein